MKSLPIFKSHYSLGKSILTLDAPVDKKGKPVESSIFHILTTNKLDTLVLVEDCMTGFLEATQHCQTHKIKLVFGLRLSVTSSIENQDEASLKKRAKYVIFARNQAGYEALIKIWSFATKDGFYYNPCIDFNHLTRLWNDNLILAIPFYDSFLQLNAFEGHVHVPEFGVIRPVVLLESNDLPFDPYLRKKASEYAEKNGFDTLEVSSIYYKSKADFIAYVTFRCISERTTVEKPELNHMGSDSFNFDRWLTNNT